MTKRGYTREEAANYLGISVWKIDELRRDGDLTARKSGQTILFPAEELDRYFESLPLHAGKQDR